MVTVRAIRAFHIINKNKVLDAIFSSDRLTLTSRVNNNYMDENYNLKDANIHQLILCKPQMKANGGFFYAEMTRV
jgi:hypothetical protein